ncbi:hypothetical protein [Verrucomicrobium sp. 3C]|uniref:hypothetical protein n=1 Tax=Verrucomicrobium sp. 3C TaxID=1134055 RepID=UPI001E6543AE|nr:hypothetical protein [Verrucomicrobium sp. 3C]
MASRPCASCSLFVVTSLSLSIFISFYFGCDPHTNCRTGSVGSGITPAEASHTPHHLPTTLNAGQEDLAIELRTQLRLPLDDLVDVIREFIKPSPTRSALGRLLRAPSATPGCLQPEKPANPTQPFPVYLPGYFSVDVKYLPQMADETFCRYVFVAKDPRATR